MEGDGDQCLCIFAFRTETMYLVLLPYVLYVGEGNEHIELCKKLFDVWC